MKLYRIQPQEFLIQNKTAKFVGISVGSGENLFIVPFHITDVVSEDTWGLTYTTRGFPKIQSGIDPNSGWIALLDSFHRGGKAIGAILTRQGDDIQLVSARLAEDDNTRWEQAIVLIKGEAVFVIKRTSPPDLLVEFSPEEAKETRITTEHIDGLLRITDQDIVKWKNKTNAYEEVEKD